MIGEGSVESPNLNLKKIKKVLTNNGTDDIIKSSKKERYLK